MKHLLHASRDTYLVYEYQHACFFSTSLYTCTHQVWATSKIIVMSSVN